jgi:hypothetical protein
MQAPIIEIRGGATAGDIAYEVRDGKRLVFADAETRMLALGCPPEIAAKAARAHAAREETRVKVDPDFLPGLDATRKLVAGWQDEEIRKRAAQAGRQVMADRAKGLIT